MIRRMIAAHLQERTEPVTPLSLANTAANLVMTKADEPAIKDTNACVVRILDVLEMCAKVSRAQFNDDKYMVFYILPLLLLRCPPSIVLFARNCVRHTSAPF